MSPAPADPVSSETEPCRSEAHRTEPLHTESLRTEPLRTDSLRAEPLHAEPLSVYSVAPYTKPLCTKPLFTEPLRTEPLHTKPLRPLLRPDLRPRQLTALVLVDDIVCTEHLLELCSCPIGEKVLRYRYTLDEMPAMIRVLAKRIESYEVWSNKVQTVLSPGRRDDGSQTLQRPGDLCTIHPTSNLCFT